MNAPTLGFTFNEVMSGGFALGETDPVAGMATGRAAGTTMIMHATILIDDLDKFLADEQHPGSINGGIDFGPLGMHLPSVNGIFKLFSPTENPSMKYMVYEIGFEVGRDSFYLAGHKNVTRSSIFNMWHATTTLYAQLHRGLDTSAPVVGAGILSLSFHDLVDMIPTMCAVNASSPVQQAEAVTKFGRFFFGEIWDTYIAKSGA